MDLRQDRDRWEGELFRLLVENVKDYAIFILDTEGRIQTWSLGAERLLGYREDEIIGEPFARVFTPSDIAVGEPLREMQQAARSGRGEDDRWHVRKDGTLFWCSGVMTPLRDRDGALRGYAKIMRDLTEQKLHEEYRRESEERFHLLVDSVMDYAIFMLDAKGNIASWNVGAERLKGYRGEEVIGRPYAILFTPEDREAGKPQEILARARAEGRYRGIGKRLRKDGTPFMADVVMSSLYDAAGTLRGYGKVTRDVTERVRQEEELKDAGRRKDEFLATLGHELRNPLAPIMSRLAVLERHPSLPTDAREHLRGIDRQMKHLIRLLDDLLDIARVTTGKIRLFRDRVDLRAVLDLALDMTKPLLEERRHHLHVTIPDENIFVHGDIARLAQVFSNLLNNSAKFTDPGGNVWITVRREAEQALVSVRDDGIGIPPDTIPRLFHAFYQAESAPERSRNGMGIGLHLACELVRLHDGAIEAKSRGPGEGSEFIVRLPVSSAQSKPPLAPPKSASSPQRLLVVDDNADAAESLATLMRIYGHEVWVVTSGEKALEMLDDVRPTAMIVDIGMPGMNGYEVARRVRQRPVFQSVRLIAVTGFGQEEDRKRSKDAGFDEHLVKPVNADDVQHALNRASIEKKS